tara:strand:+ start:16299 stop:17912 length:1614 start_codon:yes stop_codon:yes gene_type:complete
MKFLQKNQDQLGLLLLWIVIVLIVNPIGDFPLNDDWCYGKSVKTLMEDGYLKIYNWGEMTLVAHVYFGYLFTELFGFSFTVLRWSTLVLGAVSILGIYQLCILVNASRRLALLSALLCMVNPLFLGLSFSFMTDVPFYCIVIWSFYFFVKALQTNEWKQLFIAILLCCWAFLIRQIALVLPVAWLLTLILTQKPTPKTLIRAILPLFVLTILYFGYSYMMQYLGILQGRYNDKLHLLFEEIKGLNLRQIVRMILYFFVSLSYIGLLLSPIHLIYIIKNKIKPYIVIGFTFLIAGYFIYIGKVIPTLDNVWIDFGIGPTTLYDHYGHFKEAPDLKAPMLLRWIITTLGVLSSLGLLYSIKKVLTATIQKKKSSPVLVFSILGIIIYLIPFLIISVYDRYLLALLPMAIVALVYHNQEVITKRMYTSSLLFILLVGVFSVGATHDYLSWNRVRWNIINELKDSGVELHKIQGGAEFTTWYFFSETQQKWWENVIAIYAIVFKAKQDDTIIKKYNYSRWLPGNQDIYLIYDATLDLDKTK